MEQRIVPVAFPQAEHEASLGRKIQAVGAIVGTRTGKPRSERRAQVPPIAPVQEQDFVDVARCVDNRRRGRQKSDCLAVVPEFASVLRGEAPHTAPVRADEDVFVDDPRLLPHMQTREDFPLQSAGVGVQAVNLHILRGHDNLIAELPDRRSQRLIGLELKSRLVVLGDQAVKRAVFAGNAHDRPGRHRRVGHATARAIGPLEARYMYFRKVMSFASPLRNFRSNAKTLPSIEPTYASCSSVAALVDGAFGRIGLPNGVAVPFVEPEHLATADDDHGLLGRRRVKARISRCSDLHGPAPATRGVVERGHHAGLRLDDRDLLVTHEILHAVADRVDGRVAHPREEPS